jgi:hypothetical protein
MDPATGRFAGMDPWRGDPWEPGSLHRYGYGAQNPENRVDPSGRMSLTEQVGVAAISTIVASMAIGVTFAGLSSAYLPADAFKDPPDALILGFQGSIGAGRAVRAFSLSPVGLGISLGLFLTSGVGGAEALIPFAKPSQAWTYGFAGLSIGFEQNLNGFTGGGYVGFAWNTKVKDDYKGPFFCMGMNPPAVLGAAGPSVQVCSSKPAGGQLGAYSAVVSVFPPTSTYGAIQSSGTYYGAGPTVPLSDIPLAVGASLEAGKDLWYHVAERLGLGGN